MLLSQIFKNISSKIYGKDVDVSSLICNSKEAKKGSLFFAIKGETSDGHKYIDSALVLGATAIVVEDDSYISQSVTTVVVKDVRLSMALASCNFFDNPTKEAILIGITGTNGKTTTTYLLEAILERADLKPAVLGTVNYRFGDYKLDSSHTTPESIKLQEALSNLKKLGANTFVMEVSSHAIEQKRVYGSEFDIAIFSNLTRDHLDYHKSMDSYFEAKKKLFTDFLIPNDFKKQKFAIINIDDPFGVRLLESVHSGLLTYAIYDKSANIKVMDYTLTSRGIRAIINTPEGDLEINSSMIGRFNLYNMLAAISASVALGIPLDVIKEALDSGVNVPGRMERVENEKGVSLLVDYSHTGDALENALLTLNEVKEGRLITVFGCGGDRDNGKRPIMGEIATRLSDFTIITSDNPRTEDPADIINQIVKGIEDTNYVAPDSTDLYNSYTVIENRKDAIFKAVQVAQKGDIILLAGKGHEDYQIIGTTKHHFDDREEARKAFKELQNV